MNDEELRRMLLESAGPDPGAAADYRRKVEAMIQDQERRLRLGSWAAGAGYAAALLVAITLMVAGGLWYDGQLKAVWLGVNACFYLVIASVMAFSHRLARDRVEMLKELKGIEMRVIEIQQRLGKV
jgi:Na+/melibiose symporter-like transporter